MTNEKKHERILRVRHMNRVLLKLFPDSRIQLMYGNTWELLVAVTLSAQCTDKRVNEVTTNLFKKYHTIEEYARAPQRDIEQIIFRCGFYHAKARYIKSAAQKLLSDFGGVVPHTMEELTRLPGVGRKTANVILSNAFGIHEGVAVDTHVRRFAIRFELTEYRDPVRIEKDLMELMPQSEWWSFNHRLVEYGRMYCPARKHVCTMHPLTVVYPRAAHNWPCAQ